MARLKTSRFSLPIRTASLNARNTDFHLSRFRPQKFSRREHITAGNFHALLFRAGQYVEFDAANFNPVDIALGRQYGIRFAAKA